MKKGFTPNHFCQNIKQMASHVKNGTGFTLMEILVSIAILAIIGMIILNVFARSMRGGNKAQILLAIKQNGQTVLDQMDRTIRNADQVVCVSRLTGNTLVIVKDGIYTRYRFVTENSSLNQNGLIQKDYPKKGENISDGAGGTREETDAELLSRVCEQETDPMTGNTDVVVITDTNPQTGVSIQNGSFNRNKLAGFRDVITIDFEVAQGVGVSGGTTTDIDPVNFRTTIQLR